MQVVAWILIEKFKETKKLKKRQLISNSVTLPSTKPRKKKKSSVKNLGLHNIEP
jgi:hypothetical protein